MDTKGHCFPKSIIIQAVYLKLRFTLSYRDVEEIMRIRGVEVDLRFSVEQPTVLIITITANSETLLLNKLSILKSIALSFI